MYTMFGIYTTAVNWLAYFACVKFFHINTNVSNIISWILAVIFAFFTNKLLVFNNSDVGFKSWALQFIVFIGSRLLTGIIEIIGFPLLSKTFLNFKILGIEDFSAKVIVTVISVILNYIFSKTIFKKRKS